MKGKHVKSAIRPLIIALLAFPVAVLAAGDPYSSDATPTDPVLAKVKEFTSQHEYAKAAGVLREALARSPANADYHNLYAYAVRKGPHPDMDEVFRHYKEALRIDPKHRGAYEYLGEAYLMVGDVQKAREQLTQLDRLCFFGCEEYTTLKNAIANHEPKGKP
jgi:cytochrome c-type biogenesis protein CcmH/NrfG